MLCCAITTSHAKKWHTQIQRANIPIPMNIVWNTICLVFFLAGRGSASMVWPDTFHRTLHDAPGRLPCDAPHRIHHTPHNALCRASSRSQRGALHMTASEPRQEARHTQHPNTHDPMLSCYVANSANTSYWVCVSDTAFADDIGDNDDSY